MEKEIKARFNGNILEEAIKRFGIDSITPVENRGFNNFIYEYKKNSKDYILRIGHTLRSNPLQIEAEIDWINYLAEGGAGVAGAVSSVNGVFAEKINDGYGGSFIATAFKRAKGFSPWDKKYTCSEEEFSKYYGAAVGKLHHLTKKYKTNHLKQTRPEWNRHETLNIFDYIPESDYKIELFHIIGCFYYDNIYPILFQFSSIQ